jgi:hypothetical protein
MTDGEVSRRVRREDHRVTARKSLVNQAALVGMDHNVQHLITVYQDHHAGRSHQPAFPICLHGKANPGATGDALATLPLQSTLS